jgi:hypothetical protein
MPVAAMLWIFCRMLNVNIFKFITKPLNFDYICKYNILKIKIKLNNAKS